MRSLDAATRTCLLPVAALLLLRPALLPAATALPRLPLPLAPACAPAVLALASVLVLAIVIVSHSAANTTTTTTRARAERAGRPEQLLRPQPRTSSRTGTTRRNDRVLRRRAGATATLDDDGRVSE